MRSCGPDCTKGGGSAAPDSRGRASGTAALAGSGNRCWLYRGLDADAAGSPRFADAVAVRAGGREIELVNPRFDVADVDADGDLDLLAGTQPGPVLLFRNEGGPGRPAQDTT